MSEESIDMRSPGLAWMALLIGASVVGVAMALPARADTFVLSNGGLLTGEIQGSELSVTTPGGPTTLGWRDVREVTLDSVGGDVVRSTKGQAITGLVEQPTYAIRLAWGQTVTLPRAQIAVIRLRAR